MPENDEQALKEFKFKRIQKMLNGDLEPSNPIVKYFLQKLQGLRNDMQQAQIKYQEHEKITQTLRASLADMKAASIKYTEDIMIWDENEIPEKRKEDSPN